MLGFGVYLLKEVLIFYKPNKNSMKKTLNKGYQSPALRECRCAIEAGFAVSEPTGFNDLTFEGRDEE